MLMLKRVKVAMHERALVYRDRNLERVLTPGKYWLVGRGLEVKMYDVSKPAVDLPRTDVLLSGARELLDRGVRDLPAKCWIRDIPAQREAATPCRLHRGARLLRIRVVRVVRDGHVRTLLRVQHCHGAADAGVTTSDQGDLAFQLPGGAIRARVIARARHELVFGSGTRQVLLLEGWFGFVQPRSRTLTRC